MPRRELLTSAQREELLPFPTEEVDLIRYYTFNSENGLRQSAPASALIP